MQSSKCQINTNLGVGSGGIQIFNKPVLSQKYIFFSPGFVSTNGTSLNGNAGQFADQIKFRETVL